MSDEKRETLTSDDLDRVFIRAQDDHGKWQSISVKDATDTQFRVWASSRMTIAEDDGSPWTLEERAQFCDFLWQRGELHILKKGME